MSTLVSNLASLPAAFPLQVFGLATILFVTACGQPAPNSPAPNSPAPRSLAPTPSGPRAGVAVKSERVLAIEALERAHTAALTETTATAAFRQALVDAHPMLLNVPVTCDDQPTPWHRVTLNANGTKFDAIRFRSPLDVPGSLLYAFAASDDLPITEYNLASSREALSVQSTYSYRNHVELEGVDFPSRNSLVLHHVTDVVIQPETDYYLYFVFSGSWARDTYFKLKVIPDSERASADQAALNTIYDTAKRLDCRLPFRFTPTAKLADRIIDLAQYAGRGEALALLGQEQQQAGVSMRNVMFLRASIDYQEANNLRHDGQQTESDNYLFEAGKQFRELQRTYDYLERDEQDVFKSVLYDEARRLSLRGDTSEAIESLRIALENGFNEISRLLAEPDLEAVRDLPQFKELISHKRSPGVF